MSGCACHHWNAVDCLASRILQANPDAVDDCLRGQAIEDAHDEAVMEDGCVCACHDDDDDGFDDEDERAAP